MCRSICQSLIRLMANVSRGNLHWFKKILEQRLEEGINHYSSSIQLYVFQSHWHNLYL